MMVFTMQLQHVTGWRFFFYLGIIAVEFLTATFWRDYTREINRPCSAERGNARLIRILLLLFKRLRTPHVYSKTTDADDITTYYYCICTLI